jgi:hypothetical protein
MTLCQFGRGIRPTVPLAGHIPHRNRALAPHLGIRFARARRQDPTHCASRRAGVAGPHGTGDFRFPQPHWAHGAPWPVDLPLPDRVRAPATSRPDATASQLPAAASEPVVAVQSPVSEKSSPPEVECAGRLKRLEQVAVDAADKTEREESSESHAAAAESACFGARATASSCPRSLSRVGQSASRHPESATTSRTHRAISSGSTKRSNWIAKRNSTSSALTSVSESPPISAL